MPSGDGSVHGGNVNAAVLARLASLEEKVARLATPEQVRTAVEEAFGRHGKR